MDNNMGWLPCPFCGAAAVEARWPEHRGCSDSTCGAHMANLSLDQWNRRSDKSTIRAIEMVLDMVKQRAELQKISTEALDQRDRLKAAMREVKEGFLPDGTYAGRPLYQIAPECFEHDAGADGG